jgi:hypothetical protein
VYFTRSNDFYQPSLRLEEGGGGQQTAFQNISFLYFFLFVAHFSYLLGSGSESTDPIESGSESTAQN